MTNRFQNRFKDRTKDSNNQNGINDNAKVRLEIEPGV